MGTPTYAVKIAPTAERQIKKLPRSEQSRVITCLESLTTNPRPAGVEKLSQQPGLWRVRVGDYRVIYAIEKASAVVIVLIVRHRKDAYRDLHKLDPAAVAKTLIPLLADITLSA